MIRDLRREGFPKNDPRQIRPAASCVGEVVASFLQECDIEKKRQAGVSGRDTAGHSGQSSVPARAMEAG